DQRRIRPASHLLRTARPRAVARQPARPDAGPQLRLVRALDRRAGQPHSPQDRARSAGRDHDQDGALGRLHVHPCGRGGPGAIEPLIAKYAMTRFGFPSLKGIRSQITALVAASIIALHIVITAVFLVERSEPPEPEMDAGPPQLTAAIQILAHAPVAERPRLMTDIARAFPQLDIETYSGALPGRPEPKSSHNY